MEEVIFYIIAVIGLLLIIIGTLMIRKIKIKRKYIYTLLMAGGICLGIYSIYIKDLIFIVLQGIFIISAAYGLIKTNKKEK